MYSSPSRFGVVVPFRAEFEGLVDAAVDLVDAVYGGHVVRGVLAHELPETIVAVLA
jgi:hypothetical protein